VRRLAKVLARVPVFRPAPVFHLALAQASRLVQARLCHRQNRRVCPSVNLPVLVPVKVPASPRANRHHNHQV
jgi:hypothetical protein